MKKLIFIALLSIALGTMTYAQNGGTGIKGGLNLASLSTDGNDDKNLKMSPMFGVFTKIPLSESFAIQPELLFSGKGVKVNYDESFGTDGETKFGLNYIEVPVKLVFNLSEDFEFHVGPYIGYLINANTETDAEFLNYFQIDSEDELDREHFNTLDYGLSGGLGFDLDPLIFGFNYNLGLMQVAKDDDVSYDIFEDAKNRVIQVYVGIKF